MLSIGYIFLDGVWTGACIASTNIVTNVAKRRDMPRNTAHVVFWFTFCVIEPPS